jgi:hypothetical protein
MDIDEPRSMLSDNIAGLRFRSPKKDSRRESAHSISFSKGKDGSPDN